MTKQIIIYFSLLILLDYILVVTVRFFQDFFTYFHEFFSAIAHIDVLLCSQCKTIIAKSAKSTLQSPFISPETIVSQTGSSKYDLLASAVPP